MADEGIKLSRLVDKLAEELENKEIGHCMRVDHLTREESERACLQLRQKGLAGNQTYVLVSEGDKEIHIASDHAVELRNRKQCKLCLFIPADVLDPAISSLGNAFAPFDIDGFLKQLAKELRQQIPSELRNFIQTARGLLIGTSSVPIEDEISYYETVLKEPTLEKAGEELWRIGLVPDLNIGDDFHSRLQLNRKCVNLLARPSRPQTSVAERIESLGLKPNTIQPDLLNFLQGRTLQSDSSWLKEMLNPGYRDKLTFENWEFPAVEPSDLERIELDPFIDDDGRKTAYCRLKQPEPGTELSAECGPRKYIQVKWTTEPKTPTDVARWRVRLIPDRDYYDADVVGGELPEVSVNSRSRSAKIPMDIDLEGIEVSKVQVRVAALDEVGAEICEMNTQEPIEGLSIGFWLEEAQVDIEEEQTTRKVTVHSLPYACLDAAIKLKRDEEVLDIKPQPIEEESLTYYPFLFNRRYLYRVAVSPFLQTLQEKCLDRPETGGRFTIQTSGIDVLTENDFDVKPLEVGEPFAQEWEAFLKAREQCFRAIRSPAQQTSCGLVEACLLGQLGGDRGSKLQNAIIHYAQTYLNFLTATLTTCQGAGNEIASYLEAIANSLQIDTVHFDLDRGGERTQCTLILPTHPLRLLWYLAYSDLIGEWITQLLNLSPNQRRKALNQEAVKMLQPVNLPAFIPQEAGRSHAFVANLSFFYGLAFSPDTKDPDSLIGEVARLIGYDPQDYSTITISPEVVTGEIEDYLALHAYTDCLRLSVVNPGSGGFVRKLGNQLIKMKDAEEDASSKPPRRLDIVAYSTESAQYPAPGLDQLFRSVYEMGIKRGFHLAPQMQMARCQLDEGGLSHLPGGDAHLSLCIDQFLPEITLVAANTIEDSASVYGLLCQFQSNFESTDTEAIWTRVVNFPKENRREPHPVRPLYTTRLTELHQVYLHLTAAVHGWGSHADKVPAICLRLDPDRRRILSQVHNHSDWVLTLDRHLGIEYFDSPKDNYLAAEANRYLIDHTPEFIEGVGHRLFVTTAWQDEVGDILRRGLEELNLEPHPDCVATLLNTLKALSGRLALRLIGNEKRAKEAIGLAVVVEYMKTRGELENTILIPLDAHLGLFQPRSDFIVVTGERCDLLAVDISARSVRCRFIEVKYRQNEMEEPHQELLDRIVDQIEHTAENFRQFFFPSERRLDQALYRCQFAALLRFYLDRANRHGWITSNEAYGILQNIGRLEGAYPDMQAKGMGYIVSPNAEPQSPIDYRDVSIQMISGTDIDQYTQFATRSRERTETRGAPPDTEISIEGKPQETSTTPDDAGGTEERIEKPDSTTNEKTKELSSPGGEAFPRELPETIEVVLGERQDTGDNLIWKGSVKGSPHLFILGSTGAGKSTTVQWLLSNLTRQGLPSLIIDFHGDFAKPETPFMKEFAPVVIDAAEGLPFSPLETFASQKASARDILTNSFEVAEIISYVCGLGEIQRDLVYEAIRDVLTITGIESPGQAEKPPALSTVFERLRRLEQEHRSGVKNTVARCRPLFEFGLFRESETPIRFQELISQPTVIALNHFSMEVLQLAAGAFILRRLYKEMFLWGESDRLRLMVVLDEAHRLAKDISLPKLMKEGRKFGIGLVVASQGIGDFHDAVLENAGTKLLFRTNYPDSKKAAQLLRAPERLGDLAKRLENLPVGSAIAQTPEMKRCSLAHMFAG
ncbi:ATP-binding protein [Candidatus Poribacteria bacterium]|nr:ATP-binding protein [Candidatus Poribacteria bacterium]